MKYINVKLYQLLKYWSAYVQVPAKIFVNTFDVLIICQLWEYLPEVHWMLFPHKNVLFKHGTAFVHPGFEL